MSLFQRIGSRRDSFNLSIYIHYVKANLPQGLEIAVALKRGKHRARSMMVPCDQGEVLVDLAVMWPITMYWKNSSYLKKNLTIQVLRARGTRTSNDCKANVSINQIDLSYIVQQDAHQQQVKLLRRSDPDAYVCLSIALSPMLQDHTMISASSAITGTSLA
jgi:hypothetical protein